jgi:UBX domain-containing protein 7
LKDDGVALDRWALVNIQNREEFASQQLNRDTWSDTSVRQAVQKHVCGVDTLHCQTTPYAAFALLQYLLWQQAITSVAAQEYCSRYGIHVSALPHIGLLDPRTGELLHTWQAFVAPTELAPFRMWQQARCDA